ncbi:MAG: MoxR family ATPase [Candidatus Aminicenantes bacterium]|nr:MAG: MoxR family ATPase [Candidatus Aminicenantes bacterium]
MNELNFHLYEGKGIPINQRNQVLPDYEPIRDFDHPKNYIAGEGLRKAVNVALALGQPLLVTGEPGTGKTQLADSIAWELGLPALEFFTKTTSTAADLFYQYDALRRFQDAQIPEKKHMNIDDYITYQALGNAILLTKPPEEVKAYLPEELQGKGPTRSVVLIDEIDKAPRDLPNDILNEVEKMQFTVKETGKTFAAEKRFRPILVLTSNSEKNLPDAFLRRCIFYHIPFPSKEELKEIVQKRFFAYPDFTAEFIEAAIEHFFEIRDQALKKKPATAEFLGWVQVLRSLDLQVKDIKDGQTEAFALSFSILAKTREDLAMLRKKYVDQLKA